MKEEQVTQTMNFEETLGALLEMVGSPVKVMLCDRSTQMSSIVTGGVLARGQEVLGEVVDASAVVFQLDGGAFPGAFTLTSKDFESASWDALRGLHIHTPEVQAWITPLPPGEEPTEDGPPGGLPAPEPGA